MVELGLARRRRPPLNETDEIVAKNALAATKAGLVPLVCIREKRKSISGIASKALGFAMQEVVPWVEAVVNAMPSEADVVFAYEPVWAISASKTAGSDLIVEVIKGIKWVLGKYKRVGQVRFLYGGIAGLGIWNGLKGQLDGLFLSRFAHDVENLKRVLQEVQSGKEAEHKSQGSLRHLKVCGKCSWVHGVTDCNYNGDRGSIAKLPRLS